MRARGLTKTNHSTAQLATTGLTSNTIDTLWKCRYRVRTWAVAGTLAFNHAAVPDQSVSFTGTMENQYTDEVDCTIQTGVQVTANSTFAFTGDIHGLPTYAQGSATIGDIAILRPEYAVVPPSTRAQCSFVTASTIALTLLPNGVFTPFYAMNIWTDVVGNPFTGALDGSNVQLYLNVYSRGDTGDTAITPTFTLTPLAYWPYSDGTTPIWNAATGAQLAPSFQLPM